MGDSDEEYDRKRRDKFQGERGDSFRSDRRKDDDWGGRQRVRSDYRDRYQYQGDMPPPKRMRFEQDDRRMRYMEYGGGGGGGGYGGGGGGWGDGGGFPGGSGGRPSDLETQPPMMSFKAFLQTQDDSITDEEALSKYAEYKQEFRRQQLNEFFVAHKEEEWFKLKYHPEESSKRKDEVFQSLKRRAEVFMDMFKRGLVDDSRLDSDHGDQVIKLLDSVVILLEGGTDLDLTILDQVLPSESSNNKVPEKGDETKEKVEDKMETDTKPTEKENQEDKDEKDSDEEKKSETAKRKKSQDEDDENSDDEDEKKVKLDENSHENQEKTENGNENDEKSEGEKEKSETNEKEEGKKENTDDKSSEKDDVIPLTPRALHKTSSIFLRTISPRITKTEIEAICKKYPGFLRVSLADPQPEQHWFRRGWATFRRETDIKEICWSLNTIRVKDCELGAIVNRDLSRRVRTVSGISALKQVVLHDLKLCAKLIQGLDSRAGLWDAPKQDEQKRFGLISGNPMLQGITDLLVDEASAEEEELLGSSAEADDSKERSQEALKVLDRLLLYLRIVHSVDFYNQSHYPNEDEMPNRCGIMHLRGTPTNTEVSNQEIQEYTEGFRTKLEALLLPPQSVDEKEMTILGAKSQDTEVEKFVIANTQELAKDKWLCPLSGKKFKGPDFVKKHIFNKFSVELEEVRKEVDYFNNYLRDPKRPQLAEHPGNRGKKDGGGGGGYPEPFPPQFQYGGFRPRGHFGGFVRGSRGFPRGRGMDYRPIITYRDLDAPCEPEEMI